MVTFGGGNAFSSFSSAGTTGVGVSVAASWAARRHSVDSVAMVAVSMPHISFVISSSRVLSSNTERRLNSSGRWRLMSPSDALSNAESVLCVSSKSSPALAFLFTSSGRDPAAPATALPLIQSLSSAVTSKIAAGEEPLGMFSISSCGGTTERIADAPASDGN